MKALFTEHDIKVCTYDIDFAGHVSNIVYLRWLEDMRMAMFDRYCSLKNFFDKDITPVLISTEIKYKRPIRLFDRPCAFMWVSELSKITLTIEAEIYLDGILCTTAKHVGVFVEMSTGKPIRVPRQFSDCVGRYTEQAAVAVAVAAAAAAGS